MTPSASGRASPSIRTCLACAYALDLDIRWLGKQSLFKPPFGGVLRWLGGIPVVRSHRTQLVDAIAKSLEPLERGLIVIPPEGTRARAGRWKSGFYWVAVRARIPIVLSFLDYGRRTTGLGMVLEPSGDIETDFEAIQHFYAGVQGKYPDNQGELTLVDEDSEG